MQWINRNGFHMPAIKLGKRGKGGRRMREWMGRRGCAACAHPAGKSVTAGLEAWRGSVGGSCLDGSSAPKGSSEQLGPIQEFRAEWCWEVHNILPFQLPSAHTLLNTHPACMSSAVQENSCHVPLFQPLVFLLRGASVSPPRTGTHASALGTAEINAIPRKHPELSGNRSPPE